MRMTRNYTLALAIGTILTSTPVFAEEAKSIAEALKAGTTKLHLRPRIESVDQDGTDSALATTLKTRLTYTSGAFNGFGLTLEMDDTTEIVEQDYSDGVTARGTAVIADPEVTEVNQAYLSYTTGGTTLKYGRQRILLDNQRFVGGVGWRQDEQTYDAFSVTSKFNSISLFAAYVTDVNRIFGEAGDHNQETVLLNARLSTPFGSAVGYGYLIDNKTAAGLSSDTFGIRWEGKAGSMVTYNLEYATQSEAGDNPTEYSANYMMAEVNFAIPVGNTKLNIKPGYEVLGSDDGVTAFKTPLATLHAFQGWTDKFLNTPNAGIEDTYLSIGSVVSGYKLAAVYHTLSSNEGSIDYGTELGVVVGKKLGPVALTLKGAQYSADTYATDTTKVWLMAAMTF